MKRLKMICFNLKYSGQSGGGVIASLGRCLQLLQRLQIQAVEIATIGRSRFFNGQHQTLQTSGLISGVPALGFLDGNIKNPQCPHVVHGVSFQVLNDFQAIFQADRGLSPVAFLLGLVFGIHALIQEGLAALILGKPAFQSIAMADFQVNHALAESELGMFQTILDGGQLRFSTDWATAVLGL